MWIRVFERLLCRYSLHYVMPAHVELYGMWLTLNRPYSLHPKPTVVWIYFLASQLHNKPVVEICAMNELSFETSAAEPLIKTYVSCCR